MYMVGLNYILSYAVGRNATVRERVPRYEVTVVEEHTR